MNELAELVEICRKRAREATKPRVKGWWTHEANMLEKDPTRADMVRRFLK